MTPERSSDADVARSLGALSSSNRLALLRALRTPKAIGEIEVRDAETGTPLARQSVRYHLDALMESHLVVSRAASRPYGETMEFVVDHQRVFLLSDELRAFARIRPSVEPEGPTVVATPPRSASEPPGASLVLVKGLDEGTRYDLSPREGRSSWIIGRRRGVAVPLDFDPSTSQENSILRWTGSSYAIEDFPGSRNGTTVNFRRLAPGEVVRLTRGDIVGVGRCILVYQGP